MKKFSAAMLLIALLMTLCVSFASCEDSGSDEQTRLYRCTKVTTLQKAEQSDANKDAENSYIEVDILDGLISEGLADCFELRLDEDGYAYIDTYCTVGDTVIKTPDRLGAFEKKDSAIDLDIGHDIVIDEEGHFVAEYTLYVKATPISVKMYFTAVE